MISEWIKALLYSIGSGIILSSYWICLIGGLIGLILYIFGYRKAMYLIINIIGKVILCA